MDIWTARKIAIAADTVPADRIRYSIEEIRQAFWRLDRSANRGHREDRKLAKAIWCLVGRI